MTLRERDFAEATLHSKSQSRVFRKVGTAFGVQVSNGVAHGVAAGRQSSGDISTDTQRATAVN